MSVQLLDKTRKINKLLHNNNSSKVVFNDICDVLKDILNSNILVISKKGKVLGTGLTDGVEEIRELIVDEVGGFIDPLLNERLLGILSTKENVNLETLGFVDDVKKYTAIITPIDIAGERRKRITHVGNLEIVALLDPRGEQVVIGDEITTFALHEFHNVWIILRELRKIVLSEVTGFQAHQLGFGKELIKDETKNVILVFVRLNLGTHLIGRFPNLRSELLLIHLSLLIAVPANQCTAPRVTAHLP